ncbi:MAG: hypothetical protein IPN95_26955 [Bacteroidetes bacterium]|nr:hypothetical protein [Bacteroidota bacterium]
MALNDISFASATHGWAVGSYSQIKFTSDAGQTWTTQTHPANQEILRAVHFVDALHGWVAGSGETLLFTTTGGQSWLQAPKDSLYCEMLAVYFVNQDTGYVGGDCSVFGSTNWGQTWHDLWPGNPGYDTKGIHFVDTQTGWIVGNGGKINHTSTGGQVWTEQSSGLSPVWEGVSFASPTSGWVVGYGGEIAHTATAGITAAERPDLDLAELQLFPNPTNADANLELQVLKACQVEVKVFDGLGRMVFQQTMASVAAGGQNFADSRQTLARRDVLGRRRSTVCNDGPTADAEVDSLKLPLLRPFAV